MVVPQKLKGVCITSTLSQASPHVPHSQSPELCAQRCLVRAEADEDEDDNRNILNVRI